MDKSDEQSHGVVCLCYMLYIVGWGSWFIFVYNCVTLIIINSKQGPPSIKLAYKSLHAVFFPVLLLFVYFMWKKPNIIIADFISTKFFLIFLIF